MTPIPWYIETPANGILTPYSWYVEPPEYIILTPLSMIYRTPYLRYIAPLPPSMVYLAASHGISNHTTHCILNSIPAYGILTPLPIVYWTPCVRYFDAYLWYKKKPVYCITMVY